MNESLLTWAKDRRWFYKFPLPDGTLTESDIPGSVLEIHTTRERYLEKLISDHIPHSLSLDALDLASPEGYFSWVLSRHFKNVVGVEQRAESIECASKMTKILGSKNINYVHSTVEDIEPLRHSADFVLMYGLLYHVENPILTLRHVSKLTRKYLCIETQVLPYHVSGLVEDGCYTNLRNVAGLFGMVEDYPNWREGGTMPLAMVPSTEGLIWLLKHLGFSKVELVAPAAGDYEQFVRRQRVVVFAQR